MLIAVDGLPGSGRRELAERLAQALSGHYIPMPKGWLYALSPHLSISTNFIPPRASDPLALQVLLTVEAMLVHSHELQPLLEKGETAVIPWSPLAPVAHAYASDCGCGSIDLTAQMVGLPRVPKPDLILYLSAAPAWAHGRTYGFSMDYLERLHTAYEALAQEPILGLKVIPLPAADPTVLDRALEACNAHKESRKEE